MTLTEARSDTALVELALEFYRAPARFPGLRDPEQALPGDPAILLRLASGVPRDVLGLSPALGTADVLREAARFFVQQVLLAPGADYYRMHGLGRDAGDDRIKENHRLLMRMFHPDRESAAAWQDGFASRINQAYGVLRDAAKRKDYDRVLAAGGDAAARRRPTGGMRMRAWSDRELARGTPTTPFGRYVWRHLPQFVLGGVAIVAAGVVALVWWSNQPSGAIGGDGGEVKSAQEPPPTMGANAVADAAPPAAQRSTQGARPARSVDQVVVANREDIPRAAGSLQVERPAEAEVSRRGAGDDSDRIASRTASGSSTAPLKADMALKEKPGSGRTLQEGSALREPAAPQRPGTDSAPPVAMVSHATPAEVGDEPTRLIPELARRYAGGDLDAFMELFDATARNETGGYGKIRRDYDELFGTTAARQLYVWDMRWSPLGNHLWRGEGRFQARVQREGESAMRHYNGTLRIEVATQGERPLIRSIFHVLADGSR